MTFVSRLLRQHGFLAAAVAIGAATLLFLPFRGYVDFAHLAWLYLIVVGLLAGYSGTRPALFAAVLAFMAGNYFFTIPYGGFSVARPLDLIQLIVFLLGAGTVGALTGRVREREMAAIGSEREATALARMASQMAQGRELDTVIDNAVTYLMARPDVESVIVWLVDPSGGLVPHGVGARLVSRADREVATRSFNQVKAINLQVPQSAVDRLGSGWPAVDTESVTRGLGMFIPLISASSNEGVLQVVGGVSELDSTTASFAVSLSHLLAVFISSLKAAETAARVQGAEEAARVKSVIVSAVSHELKTPLAAAVAGVTDLVESDVTRSPEEVQRAVASVAEALQRLQAAISDLLDLSRLQSDEWMPHPDMYEAGEILGDVVAAVPDDIRSRLVFQVKDAPVPEVYADFTQVSRALRAVVENAIDYSPPQAPIFLGAERRDDRTALWIEDRGSGVADKDKPFVFDRAYRGQAGVRRPGSTGLGLTIANDLVEANRGRLTVEDASPTGTRIVVDLPATRDTRE